MTEANPRDRGLVLVAVLVVGLGAILLTTGLLFLTSAEVAAASAAGGIAQSRSLQWSGLQAVMAVLGDQRNQVLRGFRPRLDHQYVLYESGVRAGVVRLLPVSADGDVLDAEAGKADLNRIDAAALVRTGLFDEEAAARIIAFRDTLPGKTITSLAELMFVDGVSLEALYGPLDEIAMLDDWMMSASARGAGRRGLETAQPRGWTDILSVHSAEPAVRVTGEPRININAPLSEPMERELESALGSPLASLLTSMIDAGTTFENESSIIAALVPLQVPPSEWMAVVDALTTDAAPYHLGRLDLNTATHEALMSLEGMEPEQAARIVRERLSLSAAEQGSVLWPVTRGIMTLGQIQALAGKVTTRSAAWRVRLACGEVDASDLEGALVSPVIVEAVIDLSDEQPRLAYLREISMLETALALTGLVTEDEATLRASSDDLGVEPGVEPGAASPPVVEPIVGSGGGENDAVDVPFGEAGLPEEPADGSDNAGESGSTMGESGEGAGAGSSAGGSQPAGPGRLGRWLPLGG